MGTDASTPAPDPESAAVQHALLERLLDDEAAGALDELDVYQRLFPGHDELVARVLSEIAAGSGQAQFEGRERIGPYVLIEELGRGGQGAVFLARDTRLPRHVALKLMPRTTPELGGARAERFRREAGAASRLDHPGICGVHEFGEAEGVRYMAMRHVPGESLALHIARSASGSDAASTRLQLPAHDASGSVSRSSGGAREVDRVLSLIERAARALHVAHEAGIVHRDVKPGNIMVTPDGDPVLLDFGLARDLDEGGPTLTRSDELFGTPAYMSPEQLRPGRAPVDRRADVYALGVTLYECLTLRRPFRMASPVELAEAIERGPTPDPRAIVPALPGDLSVVVGTALAPDREHRYATALELAEDLRRVRERQPILARPAGSLVRAWRWGQRNPVLAASLALVILSLTAGLVVSVRYARQAERERALAVAESHRRQLMLDFLSFVLGSPNPLVMGRDASLGQMLDRAGEHVDARFADEPTARAEVLALLARTNTELGGYEQAAGQVERAIALERELASSPERLASSLYVLGNLRLARGDPVGAVPVFRESAEIYTELRGPTSRDALYGRLQLGLALLRAGGVDEARAIERELAEVASTHDDGTVVVTFLDLGARLAFHDARWDDALEIYERTLEAHEAWLASDLSAEERVAAEWARHDTWQGMIAVTARNGRSDRALELVDEMLAFLEPYVGADHPNLSVVWSNRGSVLRSLGRFDEAEQSYRRALAISRAAFDGPSRTTAINLNNLGSLVAVRGRGGEGLELLREGLAMLRALYGAEDPTIAGALGNIGDIQLGMGDVAAATASYAESFELRRKLHGDDHLETIHQAFQMASAAARAGELDSAARFLELYLPRLAKLSKLGRAGVLRRANEVARELSRRGAHDAALEALRETSAQLAVSDPDDVHEQARFALELARALERAGRREEALGLLGETRTRLLASELGASQAAVELDDFGASIGLPSAEG